MKLSLGLLHQAPPHENGWTVLTMVFNTELLGFGTFSIVCYSREHDVSEAGSVSVLR
jgi:hypothetical protein